MCKPDLDFYQNEDKLFSFTIFKGSFILIFCNFNKLFNFPNKVFLVIPPLAPNDAMMRVAKVRKSGVDAEK